MKRFYDDAPLGPKFLLPHLWSYFRKPLACYQSLALRYGQPFSVPFALGGRMAVTGCPLHIGRIFKGGPYESVDASAGMFYGEHSLLSLNGEAHARMRKALMSPVLRHPERAAVSMRDSALRHAQSLKPGQPFEMLDLARNITLDVILQSVFGVLDEAERHDFVLAIHDLQDCIGFFAIFIKPLRKDFGVWSPWHRFIKARSRCYELIERRMALMRQANDLDDSSALAHWLRDDSEKLAMSDEQIRDNLLMMLFAGHDSTAIALSWCFYWTHREPGVLIALQDELEAYAPSLDVSLLQNTPYLDGICRESLRMEPVAPGIARRLSQDLILGDATVPKGYVVMACIDLASHDPDIYPAPKFFRPERFIEKNYDQTEFIPFGGGERRCPGANLAFMEMRVVLATLVSRYRFGLLESKPMKSRWSHGIRRPASGVSMEVFEHADKG